VPVEAKPIFRPDVIRLPMLGISLPEAVLGHRPKLEKCAEIIASGSVDAHKEVEILGDFLGDVFRGLLGYRRAVDDPRRYTFSREARPGQWQVRRRRPRRVCPGDEAVRRGRGGERPEGPARQAVRRPEGLGGRPGVRLRHQPAVQLDPRH
jgi:hypothetical protein